MAWYLHDSVEGRLRGREDGEDGRGGGTTAWRVDKGQSRTDDTTRGRNRVEGMDRGRRKAEA